MSTGLMIIIGLISLVILYLFINYRRIKNLPDVANNPKIKVLTDKNFQHQIKNGIMLVDFWASWCMPCKMMSLKL